MNEIGDELEDVGDQYKNLEGTKWAKAYDAGWKAALENKQAKSVARRFQTFKKSDEAAMLKKEVKELKKSLHDNIEVSDVPEDWKLSNNLKITVHNGDEIAQEAQDVAEVEEAIKDSRPVRNLGASLERWGKSKEVGHIKELDKKFMASKEGQELVQEWGDVFRELDKSVMHNDHGIYIDNDRMDYVADELEDVGNKYHDLEGSKWDKAYHKGWKAALENRQAKSVGRRWDSFIKSDEGQWWASEMNEFGESLDRNIEVSDVPDSWKKEMFLF